MSESGDGLSAFGVDHGEFSKAFKPPGMPKFPTGKIKGFGQTAAQRGSAAGYKAGAAVGGAQRKLGMSVGGGFKSAGNRLGSGTLQRMGAGMQRRPGLTGGVTAGGAGLGGYSLMNNRKR